MRILMSEGLPFRGDIRVISHEIADHFLDDGQQVFWLGCHYHHLAVLRGMLGSREHRHAAEWFRSGPIEPRNGLTTYHPISALPSRKLPGLSGTLALKQCLRFTMPRLSRILTARGFDRPDLLWLSQSTNSAALCAMLEPAKTAYVISDRYESFPGIPACAVEAEREMLAHADFIFVTARGLLEELPDALRAKAHYLSNGVDVEHFRKRETASVEPEDLARIPGPRAIYVGTIAEWIDVASIARAAEAMPELSFVLIGPARIDLGALGRLANVHVLGPREYSTLPAYLHHSNVGLIPFTREALTQAVNPVKLYEYFAAGLPVVSTRLAEMERLASPAILVDSQAGFEDALRRALEQCLDRPEYQEFARANTWGARFELVRRVIRG
jgi:glycosyltransferase involved in cell wall biosynthesis